MHRMGPSPPSDGALFKRFKTMVCWTSLNPAKQLQVTVSPNRSASLGRRRVPVVLEWNLLPACLCKDVRHARTSPGWHSRQSVPGF